MDGHQSNTSRQKKTCHVTRSLNGRSSIAKKRRETLETNTKPERPANTKKGVGDGGDNYTAYIGEITGGKKHKEWHEEKKALGYGFGFNYLRHLRDAKIVVTCNPQFREGDYRLWEAFLSGAMVMVDTLYIPAWMNNPLRDGKHLVMYDPTNRTDFMSKLRYYSDPANVAEAEAIAYEGYEFVLRHHMPVDRVEYILDKVRSKLDDFVKDPVKRALFHLP